jgi:hypothetical protein
MRASWSPRRRPAVSGRGPNARTGSSMVRTVRWSNHGSLAESDRRSGRKLAKSFPVQLDLTRRALVLLSSQLIVIATSWPMIRSPEAVGRLLPEIWFSGVGRTYPWPGCIALGMFQETGHDPAVVILALGIAEPGAKLRDSHELAAECEPLATHVDDDYLAGKHGALRWVLGQSDRAPGSGMTWDHGAPTADQVVAEHHLVTRRVYGNAAARSANSGADDGLFWALGH